MAKISILIIEDDPITGRFLLEACRALSENVLLVVTGEAGLQAITKTQFSHALIDLTLPDMDGVTLLQKIRARGFVSVHCVALTADLTRERHSQALLAGFQWVAAKPLALEELPSLLGLPTRLLSERSIFNTSSLQASELLLDDNAAQIATGSAEIVKGLRQLFAQELPNQLQTIENALADKNGEELRGVLHKLRSSCSFCGAVALAESASIINRLAREDNHADWNTAYLHFLAIAQKTQQALNELEQH